jgi:hypothetical protein
MEGILYKEKEKKWCGLIGTKDKNGRNVHAGATKIGLGRARAEAIRW